MDKKSTHVYIDLEFMDLYEREFFYYLCNMLFLLIISFKKESNVLRIHNTMTNLDNLLVGTSLTLILIYFLFNIFYALHTKITTDTWVKVTLFQNSEYNIMFCSSWIIILLFLRFHNKKSKYVFWLGSSHLVQKVVCFF